MKSGKESSGKRTCSEAFFWVIRTITTFVGVSAVLLLLLLKCSHETDMNKVQKGSSASRRSVPELLDPFDPAVQSLQLSAQGQEILDNVRALREQGLNGLQLGRIVVGRTTLEEAAVSYPKLDVKTSKMQPTENIDFPLAGQFRFNVDDASGIICGVTINSPDLDLWEKHQLEKQLPLEHYQLRENSVRNKQDENVIRVYAPPNLSTKWATRSIPSIEIAKLHDRGRVVIRSDWPVHTRQKWLKINNSHLPQSKKSIDDPALAQKFRDFFQ